MKIVKHISFFYLENRINYLNQIIDETNKYSFVTDIFIHTNNFDFSINQLHESHNGSVSIIYHDLIDEHPFYLTWKCRDLLKQQKNDYDIFMYIEDDILVPKEAIEYWLTYHEQALHDNYNLGFFRIEKNDYQEEFISDLYGEYLNRYISLNNQLYCVNDKNPYCAFWIYNKQEFHRFVESKYYDIRNLPDGYEIRESSAIGLHGIQNIWYRGTIIPIIKDQLHPSSRIYHLPNNYVCNDSNLFATIRFNQACKLMPHN